MRSCILIYIFIFSTQFQYIPFMLFRANVSDYSGNTALAVLLSTFSDLIVMAIILCMYRDDIRKELSLFFQRFRYNFKTGFSCWSKGLFIMFVSNLIIINIFHSEGANNEIAVRSMIHSLPSIMFFNACFLAPFIEEFVFRKSLKDIFSKPSVFIVLSFLAFGAAHISGMATSWIDWLYIIPYGALGGAFALAYSKTDTIFTSMTFHIIHNLCVFLIVLFL